MLNLIIVYIEVSQCHQTIPGSYLNHKIFDLKVGYKVTVTKITETKTKGYRLKWNDNIYEAKTSRWTEIAQTCIYIIHIYIIYI